MATGTGASVGRTSSQVVVQVTHTTPDHSQCNQHSQVQANALDVKYVDVIIATKD